MKPYPNVILLTVLDPATHTRVSRWFKVTSVEQEKGLREYVKRSVEQLEVARALALRAQREQLIEFTRKGNPGDGAEAHGVKG